MNKKLITSAVASAVALPAVAFAAIDDQGMAYVTAAEGLGGSLRMDLFIDTNEDDRDASTETNSLRLWVNGESDLGGGLQSTYYYEFRGSEGDGTDLKSNSWDIGLKGAFGEIEFGKLAMTSYRLVPSASLAFERGSERASPGADTKDNGWRYESPVINGFQFGISGRLNGSAPGEIEFEKVEEEEVVVLRNLLNDVEISTEGTTLSIDFLSPATVSIAATQPLVTVVNQVNTRVDVTITLAEATGDARKIASNPTRANPEGSLDEYAIAVKYTMPIGLEVGAAYESVKNGKGKQVLNAGDITLTLASELKDREDSEGYRFGMRYGQDNWLLAYEYRTYDSFVPGDFHDKDEDYLGINVQLENSVGLTPVEIRSGEKDVDYQVHAFGVQVKLDRITMSANYSTDEVEMLVDLNIGENAASPDGLSKSKFTVEREVIALDAAYALGSRTNVVLGWKQDDRRTRGGGVAGSDPDDVSTTYVFYRVDF